jgi:hypothetical protein
MQLVDMASAHLNNIQNAINDLQKQKVNIDAEISKLSQYYEEGLEEIKKHADGVSE